MAKNLKPKDFEVMSGMLDELIRVTEKTDRTTRWEEEYVDAATDAMRKAKTHFLAAAKNISEADDGED